MFLRILTDMEVWILLFAAGSGYLARCWTKSLRIKDDFSDASNDINSVGSISHSASHTKRKFGMRKGRRLKTNYIGNTTARSIGEMNTVEDYVVHNDENVREASDVDTTQWCQSNESYNSLFPPVDNMIFSQQDNMASSEENEIQRGEGCKPLPQHQVLIKPNKYRMNNANIEKEISGSCAYDEGDVPVFASVSESTFYNVSEHSRMPQKSNQRYSNFSGKMKVEKNFRKQRIVFQKKCNGVMKGNAFQNNLLAQADEKSKSETDGQQHTVFCQRQSDGVLKILNAYHCSNSMGIQTPKKEDLFFGLKPLPRKPTSRKLGKLNRIRDSLDYSNPNVRQECDKEGISDSLLKCLLFNVGVGIGMMSTVMSDRHQVKHLIRLLQDVEWLLENLERMLNGRNTKDYAGFNRKKLLGSLTEPNSSVQIIFSNLRSAKDLLNHVSGLLYHRLEPASVTSQSKEMARLEAELEVELERMEIDMKGGFVSKSCPAYPAWNELDLSAGDFALGELPINNFLCGARVDEREEDCSCCCSEDAAFGYIGVSPIELASRLHELIEARQEKKILELETELISMRRKLHAKDYELHIWKKGFDGDYCSGSQEGNNCTNGGNEELLFDRVSEKHILSPIGSCASVAALDFCNCAECVLARQHTALNSSPLHEDFLDLRNSNAYIAMEGEALAVHNNNVEDDSYDTLISNKVFSLSTEGFAENDIIIHCKEKDVVPVCHDRIHDGVSEIMMAETCSPGVYNSTRLSGKSNEAHFHSMIADISTSDNSEFTDKIPTQGYVQKDEAAYYGCLDSKQTLGDTIASLHGNGVHQGHDPFELERGSCNFNWSKSCYETSSESPAKITATGSQDIIAEEYGRFASALDFNTSQESSLLSDSDELFSQSLIERIVEKRRRGSSIIKVAKSMLASFETDQSPLSID